jgi:hypothetical protein
MAMSLAAPAITLLTPPFITFMKRLGSICRMQCWCNDSTDLRMCWVDTVFRIPTVSGGINHLMVLTLRHRKKIQPSSLYMRVD